MAQNKQSEEHPSTPALEQLSSTWNAYNSGGVTRDDATQAIRTALEAGARWPEIGRAMGYGQRNH